MINEEEVCIYSKISNRTRYSILEVCIDPGSPKRMMSVPLEAVSLCREVQSGHGFCRGLVAVVNISLDEILFSQIAHCLFHHRPFRSQSSLHLMTYEKKHNTAEKKG